MNNIKNYLEHISSRYSTNSAIEWTDYEHVSIISKSYKDLYNDVCKFVSYYGNNYDFKNKNIGILGINSYEYVVSVFGIIGLGGIVVPISYFETKDEIKQRIIDTDIYAVFYDETFYNKIDDNDCIKLSLLSYEAESITEEAKFIESDINKPVAMIFTSGTTGKSKCAMLSLKNIFTVCDSYKDLVESSSKEFKTIYSKALFTPPFYHVFGLSGLFCMLKTRTTICLCGDIKKIDIYEEVIDYDYALAVPIILDKWARDIAHGKTTVINKLKTILYGGSFASKKTTDVLLDNGINIIRVYAMTETGGIGINCLMDKNTPDNLLGKPFKNIEVKIIDDEICFRGDSIMLGYYKNEDDNIIEDGWLHSGDLGYIKDGNIYISGRKKNTIILASGENVIPEEIENVLSKNTNIIEVVVKEKNDKICSVIYCKNGNESDIEEYIKKFNKSNPTYKRIGLIEYRYEPFKKNASGKILR